MPPNQNAFDLLDKGVQDWLQSDTVFQIVFELNKKANAFGNELACIPKAIVSIATGKQKPEELFNEISRGLPFLNDKDVAEIAATIKQRIFTPIKTALKNKQGIDISLLSTSRTETKITAHTMKIERVQVPTAAQPVRTAQVMQTAAPIAPPKPVAQPVVNQAAPAAAAPIPKARVVEMAHVIDLRRPMSSTVPAAPTASVAKPAATSGTSAQTMKIEGSFGAGAVKPAAAAQQPTAPKAAPSSAQKPAGESATLEAQKPFGLAEAVPRAPETVGQSSVVGRQGEQEAVGQSTVVGRQQEEKDKKSAAMPHEIVEYQDEHPTKKTVG